MKVIILGAGEVGGSLAQNLTQEASDITVVDTNSDRLRELQDRFDIRTVRGMASHSRAVRLRLWERCSAESRSSISGRRDT